MTPKPLLTFLSLIILAYSCRNVNSNKTGPGKSWLDTLAYPKQRFYSVTLFTLNADQKTTIHTDSGTFDDTSILERVSTGYSFINRQGIPKTKNFHSFRLDSIQIKRLESFLVQQPCRDSRYLDKNCVPTFKNVLVFYDENKRAIAQVHICFQCEKASFYPYEEYMCDFDNKVNYKALKGFIDSVKQSDHPNSNTHPSNNLDSWVGDYHYEETPIKANAGYAMVMDWRLSISKKNGSCTGALEVNGQQTFMKLKTALWGDSSRLAVIYDGLIDGIAGQLKTGDTLFTLTRTAQGLKTTWFSLKPRLPANPPKVCTCFK